KEISAMCGYSDPNYFSRSFKKNVGVTPTEFKNT
ncbi:MAG: AraC family transcriptional regulator, partial [Lachnospiraceae bacterium]|nr:AraC family transcriptional regulator [Lachnospiraceae bacterium]